MRKHATHLERSRLQVNIAPAQRQQIALAHVRGECQHMQCLLSLAVRRCEQRLRLRQVKRVHLRLPHARPPRLISDVARDQAQPLRVAKRLPERHMQMSVVDDSGAPSGPSAPSGSFWSVL
jgi:hypothetical protein